MQNTSFFGNMQWYHFIILLVLVQIIIGLITAKSKYRNYVGQILVTTTVATMSVIYYLLSTQFPTRGATSRGSTAATVPRLWIMLIIPTCIIFLIGIFRRKEEPDEPFGRMDIVFGTVALLVISILSFEYIGYYLASALFLGFCMYLLGYRKLKVVGIISVTWVIFTYFVFHRILYVPLPVGKLFELFI
ncbi:hypothetical protein Amet_1106 [Alkaliphilus metalliredigens QYMF]|uniref:DUF1468 domain-containing protein n=1 Tax=Alkaliphilus metalliredigens (strain QYMF) TaxID=293826 RepID=A6TM99_ALKMQ|nr:tripartite tricarboxylate transporter TctB family protein [Alkaliphilus metalliredigens]ABR47317.1 hypothetical protein Amet_1106 [Alkaliphilus metalliredigens QYMF]